MNLNHVLYCTIQKLPNTSLHTEARSVCGDWAAGPWEITDNSFELYSCIYLIEFSTTYIPRGTDQVYKWVDFQ